MPLRYITLPAALVVAGALIGPIRGQAPPADGEVEDRPASDEEPWRLGREAGLPDWLTLEGHQRTRYEALDEQFRAGLSGSDRTIALRTSLRATARFERYQGSVELLDARQYCASDESPLDTGMVDAIDVLQAWAGLRWEDALAAGDRLDLTLGRQTMDVGSRRLVARNRFRNTINAFTGLHARWEAASGEVLRSFYVLPVQRLPDDRSSLMGNDPQLDEERSQVRFFGLHASKPDLFPGADGELYAFGLAEQDGPDLATRDRDLWTIGARLHKEPAAGELDFELETAWQFGESRASKSAGDAVDLDHEAGFLHLSVGRRWDSPGTPRLEGLFDYASGDADPTDGENNRFDTLFGARRFEFGPTGIFGAFARSNLISPGYRLSFAPTADTQVMVAHRFHYLASDRDAWTTSGLVDPAGRSGDYLGNLAEIRARWKLFPGSLQLEVGLAQLFAGGFLDDAPNATGQGDATYGYVSTTFSF